MADRHIDKVFRARKLAASEFRVLIHLARAADGRGDSKIDIAELAEATEMGGGDLRAALMRLDTRGFIEARPDNGVSPVDARFRAGMWRYHLKL